jgi:hypothetical protein
MALEMSDDRVRCVKCERWMFHLAQKCPHCGAMQPARVEKKLSNVSTDEAKALLEVSNAHKAPTTFFSIARSLVMPGEGALELVLSVIAAPLTIVAVAVTGWYHSPLRPWRASDTQLDLSKAAAVPGTAVLLAVSMWDLPYSQVLYSVLGVSFVAWAIRGFRRMSKK